MFKAIKFIIALFSAAMLASCMGGSVAMQIARSIATHTADAAVANALDVQDGPSNRTPEAYAPNKPVASGSKQQAIELQNTEPDDVWLAMATSGFRPVDPNAAPTEEAAPEPLVAPVQTNTLVHVEIYNLLIGKEKDEIFEKARLIGAQNLPEKREWSRWHVATGITENNKKMITFLIPPEFGKLPSGAQTVVELAAPGDLNIARYK